MTTQQPEWVLTANLGDRHPIDYGGLFIFEDATGVYPPEVERLEVIDEDSDNPTWEIRRFILEPLKLERDGENVYLVAKRWDPSWPNPLPDYDEWFHDDLEAVAASIDHTLDEMREAFVSDDLRVRTLAWLAIGEYHGFDNLDSYPLTFTNREEVEARYKELPKLG